MPTDSVRPSLDIRSSMQRRPSQPGRIEKARNPRRAIIRLVRYLKPYSLSLALVTGFVVLFSLLGLAGPYLMGIAIDRFIGGKDLAGLLQTAGLMLAVYVLSNLFQVVANWIMARVSQLALKEMRRGLFTHLHTLSVGFFDISSRSSQAS
jgi:ATP-binding cassette subfamily B multidrug efflux pump